MISPAYTPFNGSEVAVALGMSTDAYSRAVNTCRLKKSVHFDARVSSRTAMHSLVDVVQFAVLTAVQLDLAPPTLEAIVDDLLDDICGLLEQEDGNCTLVTAQVVWRALEEVTDLGDNHGATPDQIRTLTRLVSREWDRCSAILNKALLEI